MNENDVICSGYKECLELPEDIEHIVYVGDKEVHQRPEYCSGRRPHRPSEEDGGHTCVFLKKWVEGKRVYERVF